MPRIISGTAGGTRLAAPSGRLTRPTADRTKEALFSILQSRWPADGFLDLFAGTGQIGLEAASRGAAPVVLVEKDRTCLDVIRANCSKAHLSDAVLLMPGDAGRVLSQLAASGSKFGIVFLDPPYRQAIDDFIKLAPLMVRVLADGGLVVLEHEARMMPVPIVTNLQLERSCQYGTAMLSFYKKGAPAATPV